MFSSVTISHILKNENYELCFLAGSFVNQIMTGKQGAVVWPSVGMFGGSISLDCFGGFLNQIRAGKKGYSHLAIGCNVWGVSSMRTDCFGGFIAMFFGGFLDQNTNYDQKKKRDSHLAIGWNVYYVLLTYYTLVDRPSAMTPWGIYPGRKIPALPWGPVNNVEPVPTKSEPPQKQSTGK